MWAGSFSAILKVEMEPLGLLFLSPEAREGNLHALTLPGCSVRANVSLFGSVRQAHLTIPVMANVHHQRDWVLNL